MKGKNRKQKQIKHIKHGVWNWKNKITLHKINHSAQ